MVRQWKKVKRQPEKGRKGDRAGAHYKSMRHRTAAAPVAAVPCVWLHVITETPLPHHHHSLFLQVCLPFTAFPASPPLPSLSFLCLHRLSFPLLNSASPVQFSLSFLIYYSRMGSRISLWCYDSLLIWHLCFFHLSLPSDGTYFGTSCSLRPLPLVVPSVCVSPAWPPPCLRLVQPNQTETTTFLSRTYSAPLTLSDNMSFHLHSSKDFA